MPEPTERTESILAGRLFPLALAWCGGLGLTIRLVYAFLIRFHQPLQYDAPIYRSRSIFLLDGRGFLDPDVWNFHQTAAQSAIHGPVTTLWFAAARTLGVHTDHGLVLLGCLTGTATIIVVGLAGRALIGPRVGLVAAFLTAIHAGFWSHDPIAMSESPAQLLTAITLLLAIRFWRRPSPSAAAWMGVAASLAALTRAELVVLLPGLVVPLALATRGTLRQAATRTGAALLLGVLVLAPWVGWNLVRFEHPVLIATGADVSAVYAQCKAQWYGAETGSFSVLCNDVPPFSAPGRDESITGERYRATAGRYIRAHRDRWPTVIAARVGRTLGVFRPLQQADFDSEREPRDPGPVQAALAGWYVLVGLSVVALVRPPVNRWALLMLLTPLGAGLAGAAATFGSGRYRAAGEVGIVLLAAAGVEVLCRAVARRRAPGDASGTTDADAVPVVVEDDDDIFVTSV